MSPLRYSPILLLLLAGLAALVAGGWWTVALPVFSFVLLPLVELPLPGTTANPTAAEEAARKADWRYDALVFALVPLQVAVVLVLMARVSSGALAGWEVAGAVATAGILCGAIGINVAHELGHRRGRWSRLAAKVLLLTSLYLHFFIEHNRGHHVRVATDEDPASARRGEWLYTFWVRSVALGWLSAWRLEAERLGRKGGSPWSLRNEMVRFQLVQGAALVGAVVVFGAAATAAFVAAAVIGSLLLETVNYVEHYGLRRARDERGRYETVRPEHSWNANRPAGRTLLLELTRHSDHHAHPTRPFPVLRHFDDSPQLPTGYPGMILLATVPPLFFKVMDPAVERWHASRAPAAA